ncbi:MAG: peroxidase [Caldilinea sp. CFX5]|nr:peroxidase [Caldilinea sp. CFX5]
MPSQQPRHHGQVNYFIEGEGIITESEPGVARALATPLANTERLLRFSRLFPNLPKLRPSPQLLATLGQLMVDNDNDNPLRDHPRLPAGFTYLGQFIDHDLTFDQTTNIPTDNLPLEEIIQGRTPSLDLDSVYGRGPDLEEKRIYAPDKVHLRIGVTTPTPAGQESANTLAALPNDLPRGDDPANPAIATIGDPRNDENLAVGQTHLAFLKFHNKVVDRLAATGLQGAALFTAARRLVTLHYQWIVLHDFLPRFVDSATLSDVLVNGRKFYQFIPGEEPTMPLEFSVAGYRLGHSMVRRDYHFNIVFQDGGAPLELLFTFSGNSGDLGGNPTLPTNWVINWKRFYDFSPAPLVGPEAKFNPARRIDTFLIPALHTLPGGDVVVAPGSPPTSSLAVRNLLRGRLVGLPSGQAVATAMGAPVLTPFELFQGIPSAQAQPLRAAQLDTQTPLWYYILKEAEVLNSGLKLGPVGSRIVAETFVGLIEASRTSILTDRTWRPTLPALVSGTSFTMADLLLFVNDLNPLEGARG